MEHGEARCPGGYRFGYDDALFRPGTDTFLLSSLPRLRPCLRVVDLGCGTGLLGLLLVQRQPELRVTGVDIQPEAIRLAEQAAAENGLQDRLAFHAADLRNVKALFPTGSFDLAVCNPPYYPSGSGALSADGARRTARAEVSCTLEDVCAAAAYLLRWGGRLCLVHKPERLADLLAAMRACAVEPKRLRFVQLREGQAPSLVLAEGCRGGKPGRFVEAPLLLQTPDGSPTAALDAIYFRQQEDTP